MISSIDNVLVRAAASSIASGRPSSERHRSCTASSASLAGAAARGATGEQLDGVGERKRRELEHGLAVDVERNLAGAQDPQPGGGVEEADGERRGSVDDVLAVVEDHHRGGALEPLEQRRLAARDVQRGDQRVEDVVGRRRGLEPGQPDATGATSRQPSRPVAIATAVFPIPPGPTISTSRLLREQVGQGGDLRLASDELGRHRRQVPGRRARSGRARAPGRGRGSAARAAAAAVRDRGRARPPAGSGPAGRSPARRPGVPLGTAR